MKIDSLPVLVMMCICFILGTVFGLAMTIEEPTVLAAPLVLSDANWVVEDTFVPVMRAIAMKESSGGKNQKPNVDGIVGIGQVEKSFYADAREFWQRSGHDTDFPAYEDLRGYDEDAFESTCVVAWYWFRRYKADTPYLMFCRYRKGPHGEDTETGRAYARDALKIMETYLKEH